MFCVRHCSIAVVVLASIIVLMPAVVSAHEDCNETDAPLLCHGNRVIRSVVDQVLDSDKSFRLVPGIEIVQLPVNETSDGSNFGGRSSVSGGSNGYIDRVFKYLQGHELKINLHDLLKNSDVHGSLSRTFNEVDIEKEIIGTLFVYNFGFDSTESRSPVVEFTSETSQIYSHSNAVTGNLNIFSQYSFFFF